VVHEYPDPYKNFEKPEDEAAQAEGDAAPEEDIPEAGM